MRVVQGRSTVDQSSCRVADVNESRISGRTLACVLLQGRLEPGCRRPERTGLQEV